jgi:hypothetical protein
MRYELESLEQARAAARDDDLDEMELDEDEYDDDDVEDLDDDDLVDLDDEYDDLDVQRPKPGHPHRFDE